MSYARKIKALRARRDAVRDELETLKMLGASEDQTAVLSASLESVKAQIEGLRASKGMKP